MIPLKIVNNEKAKKNKNLDEKGSCPGSIHTKETTRSTTKSKQVQRETKTTIYQAEAEV
jgi:hypothetical protein